MDAKYFLILFISIVIIGLGVYVFTQAQSQPTEDKNTSLFLDNVHAYTNFIRKTSPGDYEYFAFQKTPYTQIDVHVIHKMNGDVLISIDAPIYGWAYYRLNISDHNISLNESSFSNETNETNITKRFVKTVCLSFGSRRECVSPIPPYLNNVVLSMVNFLNTEEKADEFDKFFDNLAKWNALSVIYVENNTNNMTFLVKYSLLNLSVNQLSQIGIPGNSRVAHIPVFYSKIVFDKSNGMLIYRETNYVWNGENTTEIFIVKNITTENVGEVPFVNSTDNFGPLYGWFTDFWKEYSGLNSVTDKKERFTKVTGLAKTYGLPKICLVELSGNDSLRCLDAYTAMTKDYSACGLVENETIRDVCYLRASVESGDESICSNILNETLRLNCTSMFNETEENETSSNTDESGTNETSSTSG